MPKSILFFVSSDTSQIAEVQALASRLGAEIRTFAPDNWRMGLRSPVFRESLDIQLPALASGASPLADSRPIDNVIEFRRSPFTETPKSVATINDVESAAISQAIEYYNGNLTEAAKALGIGRATLYRKVKLYKIDPNTARRKRSA